MDEQRTFIKVTAEAVSGAITEIKLNNRFFLFYFILMNLVFFGVIDFLRKNYSSGIYLILSLPAGYICYNIEADGILSIVISVLAYILMFSWPVLIFYNLYQLMEGGVNFPPSSDDGWIMNTLEFDTKIGISALTLLYYQFMFLILEESGAAAAVLNGLKNLAAMI